MVSLETPHLYLGLIVLVALERLVELVITKRHVRRLLARGGVIVGERHYRVMVVMHTLLLVAAPLLAQERPEFFLVSRPFIPVLAAVSLAVVVLTMGLRYWVISTLGERWTTQVVVVPGEAPVVGGPYRFLRHPNYLAVVLEIVALPLVHGAYLTALVFSLANAWVLRVRIRIEEAALEEHSPYQKHLGHRARFLPTAPREERT